MTNKKNSKKQPDERDDIAADDVLKDMVKSLNELPTETLEQLLRNLEEIEEYNKTHPFDDDDDE